MKKLHASFSLALSILLMLCGCSDRPGLMPPSGGRLFEVLVVGDDSSIVRDVLQQDVPGLPQSEPQFDVSAIKTDAFKSTLRLSRCIVRLLLTLNKTEMSKSLSMIRNKRNIKAERLIQKMFGITMWVPADFVASKQGNDFVWLSNNSPTVMKNIVVYRDWNRFRTADGKLNYYDNPIRHFTDARNYWLGRNIKGETDAMHMSTVGRSVTVTPFGKHADGRLLYRGLWEMTGDDMGGPFVSLAIPLKSPAQRGNFDCWNTVVEGFTFAPGKKKRNAMRELEALLYTVKVNKKSNKNQ